MNVQIKSHGHGFATVLLNGEKVTGITSLKLQAGEPNVLIMERLVDQVEFEGEANVIARIDGRSYRLIEEDQL